MNSLLKTDYQATDSSQIVPTFKKIQSEVVKEGLIYKLLSDNKTNIDLLHKVDEENPSDFAFARKALNI
jgi:proline iminopeptidase